MLASVAAGGFFDIASFHALNVAQGKGAGEATGHREARQGGASDVANVAGEKEGKEEKTASAQAGQGRAAKKPNGEPLTEGDQARIRELESIDRKVRQHEQAHMAAGGNLVTSSASYSYTEGPDGKRYVTGGEVGIDTSKGRTPEETLTRARQIRSAALAPADPSPQDRSVAAAASQMEMQALQEIAQQQLEAAKGEGEGEGAGKEGAGEGAVPSTSAEKPETRSALSPNAGAVNEGGVRPSARGAAMIEAYQDMMRGAARAAPEARSGASSAVGSVIGGAFDGVFGNVIDGVGGANRARGFISAYA
jgi:hypothetical protein